MDLPQPIEIARVRQPVKQRVITQIVNALTSQDEIDIVYMRASEDEQWLVFFIDGKEVPA